MAAGDPSKNSNTSPTLAMTALLIQPIVLYSLWIYAPNKGASIFFAIAYGISAMFHIWQCFRYNSFRLIGLHPLCAATFTSGYALRAFGADNYIYSTSNKTPLLVFIMSQVFIYVCPPLLELANYQILGRLFYYVPYQAPLPAKQVLKIFGGLMAIVEILNALGVTLSAKPSSSRQQQVIGSRMTVAAIAIHLMLIVVFASIAARFHVSCTRANIHAKAVKTPLFTLYLSMTLIFVRCIYRLVEHTGNTKIEIGDVDSLRKLSPFLRYEAFFLVFEATLMFFNSALWNIWHPGRYLPREYHIHLAQDGTEIEGEAIVDNRSLVAKTAHVLTFGMLYRRRGRKRTFHELFEYPTTRTQ